MIWFDPAEFRSIYQAHASPLVLYARQWMGCDEAEDVVQDVFIRLAQQSAAPAAIMPWLYRSVRNAAVSAARSARRRRQREQRAVADFWFEARPADLIDAADAQAALQALPGDLREIVVLRIWSQLT